MESSPLPNESRVDGSLYDLGILFVHGIGDQAKGFTLVQFGTPLYEWLAERADAVCGSVRIADAVVMSTSDEPAHSEFRLQVQGEDRRWLLAEAWWADSFATPRFSDFAQWALGVAPRTFGSHFGAALARAWRSPKATPRQQFARMSRVFLAFINLLIGIALSFFLLVFLLGLLIVGLIPIRRSREAIAKVQLRLASSIGDSYVLIARPMESAAILTRFRQNLAWLESRCSRVAIVAHSQGSAVACLALQNLPGSSTRLLVTFGSGLRKLEELSELRSRPSYRRGALLTTFGFVLAAITVLGFPNVVRSVHDRAGAPENLLIWTAYSAIGWTILIAGLRDFIVGIEPQKLKELGKDLSEKVSAWKDIYASADPVPNGPLHDEVGVAPTAIPVVNFSSFFRDHTTYWQNHDGFVALLADLLLRFDAPAKMVLPEQTLEFLTKRRAARVNYLRFSSWMAIISVIALLFRYPAEWIRVLSWATRRAPAWITRAIGLHSERSPGLIAPSPHDWWRSIGLLATVIGAYVIARGVWSSWNRLEMHAVPIIRRFQSQHIKFIVSLWLLVAVGGFSVYGDFSSWIFAGSFAVVFAFLLVARWPSAPPGVLEKETSPLAESWADRAAHLFWNYLELGVMLFGFPMGIFYTVSSVHKYLGKWIPAGKLGWLMSVLALVAGWLLLAVVSLYVVTPIYRRLRKSSTP